MCHCKKFAQLLNSGNRQYIGKNSKYAGRNRYTLFYYLQYDEFAIKADDNNAQKGGEKYVSEKQINFKSLDSLQPVVSIVNEASAALQDKKRTITQSPMSEILAGVLGAGVGSAASFATLWGLGITGLSAAGITSALAAAGTLLGGGMVAGIFVLSAPVAILGGAGVKLASAQRQKQLHQEKERLLKEAIEKNHAIITALKKEVFATKERAEYLKSLNIMLQKAVKDLQADLEIGVA